MSNKFNREIYRALLNEYSDNPSKNFKRKLKASATDGFNLGMYDLSDETFDVKNYRQRIRQARSHHPEYNWRQRRAAALVDVLPQERGAIDLYPTTTMPLSLPTQGSGVPSIVVGYPEVDSVTVSPNKVKMTIHENIYSPRKLSFNQFAGMLDDMMYQQNALTAGQDLNAWQVHRAKEYERYYNDPQNYVYTPIDPSFTYTSDDIAKYRNMGILANNRGIEYYNPSDMRGSYIFKGKSWNDITRENNIPSGKTFSFVSETGDPVDVATLSRIVPKIQNPEAQRAVRQYIATRNPIIVDGGNTVVVDAPHVSTGVAPQDNFYRAANYGEMGIAALATAPAIVEYGVKPLLDAVTEIGPGFRRLVQRGRDTYGRMLEENSKAIIRSNYPGHGGNAFFRWNGTSVPGLSPYSTYGGRANLVWDPWKGIFKHGGKIK